MKMKQMISTVFILLLLGMLAITFNVLPSSVAAEDSPHFEVLDEIGKHFELPCFNISITTDADVHMFLRACSSEMISYFIETASDAISTQITLGYLKPFTTYYMYDDSCVNENAFITDGVGTYTYTQDLSEPHHVFIQPESSTIYISKSTTLLNDIHDTVEITADNIILDLNGHDIYGMGWFGIMMVRRTNVTIKNGGIKNSLVGIYLSYCRNVAIRNTTMSSNSWSGIEMSPVSDSLIAENNFIGGGYALECGWSSSGNKIYHNNFGRGCWTDSSANNWDDGYPSGGNYWSGYTGVDLYNGPGQNIAGSDGIGDSPRGIPYFGGGSIRDYDYYPLMNPWTPTETTVQIGGVDEAITIVSNTDIGKIVANKNNLKFTSSGTGYGYINLILRMSIVTIDISVYIDRQKVASPFPIINTNGTHYYVYFEFALSTHVITVQFAPSIVAIVDIDPDTLNLKNNGQWITGYIEPTEGYDVNDIDVSTIMLDGTISAELYPTEIGDYDHDGVFDLMVKFDRAKVSQYILDVQGITHGNVTLTIRGEMYDGATLEGSDTIRVRMPGDVDCDGKVDMIDVSLVAKTFGKSPYNFFYDLNEDGANNMVDLSIACKNFGKKY